jgi:RNA polymerase sigma-70 factor (ECF subfamily)
MAIEEARAAVDASVFGRVFDESLDVVYGFVARRLDDRDAAEAVTARTFERGLEAVSQGSRTLDELPGFLLRVAASAVVDHARRQRRDIPLGVRARDLDEAGDAESAAWLADAAAARLFTGAVDAIALRRATLRLEDPDLRIVLLRYLDGLETDAIAAAVGCPNDEAALRLHRALAALHASLPRSDANVA